MPRHRKKESVLSTSNILHIVIIPLATALFVGIGWYYTTNYRLNEVEAGRKEDQKEARDAREKLSSRYFEYQQKTNEILSKLDSRLAVNETKQEVANQALNRIVDELRKLDLPRR